MPEMLLREIASADDPLLPAWLDLYESSFPPRALLPVERVKRELERERRRDFEEGILLAACHPGVSGAEALLGLAWFHVRRFDNLFPAYGDLWYLAVDPNARNRGFGGSLLEAVCRHVAGAGGKALFWAVEHPNWPVSGVREDGPMAARRIRFYQRQGAFLLREVRYFLSLGGPPYLPMHLMVKPLAEEFGTNRIFALAQMEFGCARTGEGYLDPGPEPDPVLE
jgi:ribosomal protein S18 acetylase RimI-like enzyme